MLIHQLFYGILCQIWVDRRCTESKHTTYTTINNNKNDPDRIELKKYCRFCKKQTVHSETK